LRALQAYGRLTHWHEPLLSALALRLAADPEACTCQLVTNILCAFAILGFTHEGALGAARASILGRCARGDRFTAQQ
jgi:hypothetical protein